MKRLSRKLRVCKWIGTILCLLIVVAFVFSVHHVVRWASATGDHAFLMLGAIMYRHVRADAIDQLAIRLSPGWRIIDNDDDSELYWWIEARAGQFGFTIDLPLWMPFVALAIPTVVLWYRDRRRIAPGYCAKCGYNLTGNTTGRCPECGTPT